jgi:hypothetical protein
MLNMVLHSCLRSTPRRAGLSAQHGSVANAYARPAAVSASKVTWCWGSVAHKMRESRHGAPSSRAAFQRSVSSSFHPFGGGHGTPQAASCALL